MQRKLEGLFRFLTLARRTIWIGQTQQQTMTNGEDLLGLEEQGVPASMGSSETQQRTCPSP